jgi:flagellar protein FlaF
VNDKGESEKAALSEALLYNRKLWQIFLVSVTGEDSTLPPELRQNVANLGLFVMNQTMSILADPKPGRLNALININRELAAGLRGVGQAAAR